jgi:hypothetical protein
MRFIDAGLPSAYALIVWAASILARQQPKAVAIFTRYQLCFPTYRRLRSSVLE